MGIRSGAEVPGCGPMDRVRASRPWELRQRQAVHAQRPRGSGGLRSQITPHNIAWHFGIDHLSAIKRLRENRLVSTPYPHALRPHLQRQWHPRHPLVTERAPPPARPVPWYRSPGFDFAQFAVLSGAAIWMIVRGARSMGYDWQWAKVPRLLYRVVDGELIWGPLMKGLFVTLDIAWIAMLLTIAIGLATAILRLSQSIVGRAIARVYIEVIRNTPLLVQILIFYFIIGRILGIPRIWAGILCLAFYEGAFAAEIIRGGIIAVHKGQCGGEPQPRTLDTRYVP